MSNDLRNSIVVGKDEFVYRGDEMVKKTLELLEVEEQLANNPWVIDMFSRTIMKDIDLKCDYTEQEIAKIAKRINKNGRLSPEQRKDWFETCKKDSPNGTEYYGFVNENVGYSYPKIQFMVLQNLFSATDELENDMRLSFRKCLEGVHMKRREKTRRGRDKKEETIEEEYVIDKYGIVLEKESSRETDGKIEWTTITRDEENPMIARMEKKDKEGNEEVLYYPINPIMMQDVVTQIVAFQDEKTIGHVTFPTREEAVEYWEKQNLCQQMAGRLTGRYGKGLRKMLERAKINIPEESREE